MKTLKTKKCKVCEIKYTPFSSLIKHCSPECGYELHKLNEKKKQAKKDKEWSEYAKAWRKDNKKKSEWIKDAQTEVNTYVRLRDHGKPCISCDGNWIDTSLNGSKWHAGHYRSRGSAGHLRFNLHNIHLQCAECNIHKSGNITEYRPRLLVKLGIDKLEALEANNDYKKIDRVYCERVIKIFKKRVKIQRTRLGID